MEIIVKYRKDLDSGYGWEVFESITQKLSNGEDVIIPKGMITDFASVPKIFWSIIPSIGTYNAASLLHDYLYQTGYMTRRFCDREFLYWLNYLNPDKKFRNYVMFAAVRLFGYSRYKKVG